MTKLKWTLITMFSLSIIKTEKNILILSSTLTSIILVLQLMHR